MTCFVLILLFTAAGVVGGIVLTVLYKNRVIAQLQQANTKLVDQLSKG